MNESPNDMLRTAAILRLTECSLELGLPFVVDKDTFKVALPQGRSEAVPKEEDPELD